MQKEITKIQPTMEEKCFHLGASAFRFVDNVLSAPFAVVAFGKLVLQKASRQNNE